MGHRLRADDNDAGRLTDMAGLVAALARLATMVEGLVAAMARREMREQAAAAEPRGPRPRRYTGQGEQPDGEESQPRGRRPRRSNP